MFERFNGGARRVVVLAQEEARMLNHDYIDTEHILLGLIRVPRGVAARTLESLGIRLEAVLHQVEEIIGWGQQAPSGNIPFTPRAKKVLELSLRESLQLGHNYIGTEHILLGLIHEGDGMAAQVLVRLGADLNRVRQQLIPMRGYQGHDDLRELVSGFVDVEAVHKVAISIDRLSAARRAVYEVALSVIQARPTIAISATHFVPNASIMKQRHHIEKRFGLIPAPPVITINWAPC